MNCIILNIDNDTVYSHFTEHLWIVLSPSHITSQEFGECDANYVSLFYVKIIGS